jgi:hypothetical protein
MDMTQKQSQKVDFKNTSAIAVMAVDNLPCELPKDASEGFGNSFVENILPAFFNNDHGGILNRAKMTENRKINFFIFLFTRLCRWEIIKSKKPIC